MWYFPLLNVCFVDVAPIFTWTLVPCGQCVENPPHRPGGYRWGSQEQYRLLYTRACDMDRRRKMRY